MNEEVEMLKFLETFLTILSRELPFKDDPIFQNVRISADRLYTTGVLNLKNGFDIFFYWEDGLELSLGAQRLELTLTDQYDLMSDILIECAQLAWPTEMQ